MAETEATFERVVAIMARLRGPEGCPWDRRQTFETIVPYTLEETYEVAEAIERRDWTALQDELGDLLLQVLFYSQMASEAGYFNIADVIAGLSRKLIERHPHVFEDESGMRMSAEEALGKWESRKPRPANSGRLGGVSRGLPALLEARKLGARAAAAGFDWPDAAGVLAKLEEEIAEIRAELSAQSDDTATSGDTEAQAGPGKAAEEAGDLLFTMVNLARKLGADPEATLKRANRKFRRRFERLESLLQARGSEFERAGPEELERLWEQVKREERR